MALVDSATLRVEGYFEETKLPKIHKGDPVQVRLMGESRPLTGHVESIATGIADRERTDSPDLLANINPTFNWVRLAQRVPVRVKPDVVPTTVQTGGRPDGDGHRRTGREARRLSRQGCRGQCSRLNPRVSNAARYATHSRSCSRPSHRR